MPKLESRLDTKAHLLMRKLDKLLTSNKRADCSDTNDMARKPNYGFRNSRHTDAPRDREQTDCTHFWDAVADAKNRRHKEALSRVKHSRVKNEAILRKKELYKTFLQPRKRKQCQKTKFP